MNQVTKRVMESIQLEIIVPIKTIRKLPGKKNRKNCFNMDLKKYRKDAESFLYKIEKEYYLHFSGQKDNFNVSDIYNQYEYLFTREDIDYIKNLKDISYGEEKKKAAYLLRFCVESYIDRQTKGLIESIAEDEARANVVIEGKKELNISLISSRKSDFAFIKRAKKYDRFFGKDKLIPTFKDTLSEMGMDISGYTNIHLDVGERENKSPRAFCSVPGIPSEIYLVVMPGGGQDDYEALLHEGGHALHFGNTDSKLDFEYKYMGDNAVTEGFAFSMEQLMQNRDWLIDFLKMPGEAAEEFVYFSNLIKLWFCRRYAGKLRYELILHDGKPLNGKDLIYKEILSGVNLMDYPAVNYLRDVDNGFYCTNYIRAWIFQSQLKEYIYKKFGRGWYKNKKAGLFLRELWNYGQKYSADEILST